MLYLPNQLVWFPQEGLQTDTIIGLHQFIRTPVLSQEGFCFVNLDVDNSPSYDSSNVCFSRKPSSLMTYTSNGALMCLDYFTCHHERRFQCANNPAELLPIIPCPTLETTLLSEPEPSYPLISSLQSDFRKTLLLIRR